MKTGGGKGEAGRYGDRCGDMCGDMCNASLQTCVKTGVQSRYSAVVPSRLTGCGGGVKGCEERCECEVWVDAKEVWRRCGGRGEWEDADGPFDTGGGWGRVIPEGGNRPSDEMLVVDLQLVQGGYRRG